MTNSVKQHSLCVKDRTTKTIASGVITVDQIYHVVAAQTGTTDDLDTISLGYDSLTFNSTTYRPVLMLIADGGDTITIKHGTGNIDLPDDTDVILTDDAHVWLLYDGTNWTAFKAVVSTTSVTASMVGISTLGTPTYTTIQNWLDTTQSAGVISGGDISDNGDGTVTAAAGEGFVKTTDSAVGSTPSFNWAEDTSVSLTTDSDNWIYVDYNSGTPIVDATTSLTSLDLHTQIVIGKVYRESGTTIHIVPVQQVISDFMRLAFQRVWELDRVKRASGLSLSATGTRNIAISAGVLWAAYGRLALSARDTSVADTFTYVYRDGGSGYTFQTGQTQIDNTNYDNNSGTPTALTAGRYGNHWVYTTHDGEIYVQYGQGDYTLAQAQAALVPTPPAELIAIGTLVGKIIIQKSASSFTQLDSAFVQTFEGTTVTDHGALAGLTDDDHTQYALLAGRAGGQTLLGGTGSGDDLHFRTTSNGTKGAYFFDELTTTGKVYTPGASGNIAIMQEVYNASTDPTVNNDVDEDFIVGSRWINTTADREWICLDNTDGAAVWVETTHPMTTAGDVLYYNGTLLTRLPIGTASQVLAVNSGATAPEWQDISTIASKAIVEDQKAQNTAGGTFTSGAWRVRDLNTIVSDTDNIISIWYLAFTSGGTYEVVAGDVITGATSSVTATVFGVELTSGTWAGGDAAGTLWILDNQSGAFVGENLNVGANLNVATIAADSVNDGKFALLAGTYDLEAFLPAYDCDAHQGQLYNVTDAAVTKVGSTERADAAGNVMSKTRICSRFTIAALKVYQLQHQCGTTVASAGFGRVANFTTEVYSQMVIEKLA